jgi:POT family proton-dependent oligopeptide transporter
MNGHGIPNDLMQNFDPIAILFFAPILDRLVYPLLQKYHIPFRPIARISLGFVVASMSMLYAAILQHHIYQTGPCYDHPLKCPAALGPDGVVRGNNIHIAIQTPAYMLIGVSEIFASVAGLEYAYMKAPPSMKSFVQAMYLLTNGFGYAIGEAFTPLIGDPEIMWLFVGLCCVSFGVGVIFWLLFRKYDQIEDEVNSLDAENDDLAERNTVESPIANSDEENQAKSSL